MKVALPFLRRFGRAAGGATAVEFALVATPFLFLLFSIFEIGRLYTLSSVLEDATMEAGRRVRTGELQTAGGGESAFRDEVCSHMSVFASDCAANLEIDVRAMPNFASQNPPDPIVGDRFDDSSLRYQPGSAEQIVLVRTWWKTPLFVPMITQGLRRMADDTIVLSAATTFRNEPYQ